MCLARQALVLAAALLPLAVSASTYRWVDAQGHTHYSDVPAPQSERVEVKPSSGVVKGAPSEAEATRRAAECQRQRDQLANYNAASEIRETDALGNTRSYSAEEKTRLLARTRQQMEDACKGQPAGNATPDTPPAPAVTPAVAPPPAPAPRVPATPGAPAES